MFILGQLLRLWAKGRYVPSHAVLLQQLLVNMAVVVLCVVIAVMLAGILLLGVCTGMFYLLLGHDFTVLSAGLTVGGSLLVMIIALLAIAWNKWVQARGLPRRLASANNSSSISDYAHDVIDAFLNGLGVKNPR